LIILFVVSNASWIALGFYNKTFPYAETKKIVKILISKYERISKGENKFIIDKVNDQILKGTNFNNKIIETSVLPLSLNFISLSDYQFPFTGGGLFPVNDKLLLLDRLGNIYTYENSKVYKLSLILPNNLKEYLLNYDGEPTLHGDSLRAHSIVFNKDKSSIIVSYTRFEKDDITRLVVSSIKVNPTNFHPTGKWKTLFISEPLYSLAHASQSGAGKILLKDNELYIAIGYDTEVYEDEKLYASALDKNSNFGKIVKLNLDSNNPVVYTSGHRNTQGMAIFNENSILSTEHGPQGGDEVNLIEEGLSYGWPIQTYGTRYGTFDYDFKDGSISNISKKQTLPLFSFVPSIGISSILQVKNFHDRWDGDILVGSLKAQTLFRLKYVDGRVVFQEPIWIGHRIRDIVEINNKIVLLTDNANLIEISVDFGLLSRNQKGTNLISLNKNLKKCIQCHHFGQTSPSSLAPSLLNIVDRGIGKDSYSKYSINMSSKVGLWTKENLKKYIKSPPEFIEGTSMPNLGLTDEEVENIVNILSTQ